MPRSTAEADKLFAALSDGGQVRQPLIETFFSPRFGMLADKFGVGWMIMVERPRRSQPKRIHRMEEIMSTQAQTKRKPPDFVISRTFNAPRELVWQAFTDPERMKAMVGPEGLHRDRLQDGF